MKLLFVTRKYPPIVGGLETFSYDLYTALSKKVDVTLWANPKGNKYIVPFYIKTFFYLIFNAGRYTNIHLGDGALSLFIPLIRIVSRAKVTITTHGRDVILQNPPYQLVIPRCLKMADKIVCVSNYTLEECVRRGIPRKKCVFIPNGINFENIKKSTLKKAQIEKKFNLKLAQKKILFTVGRLVKRKGHEWFIREVMPKLGNEFIYVFGGEGPEKDNILKTIKEIRLKGRVFMLGKISDDEKNWFFDNAYYFIMPNIHVDGDAEGFGIVAIEAAAHGLPVIASDVDGLRDAVIDQKTGFIIPQKNSIKSISLIENINLDKQTLLQTIRKQFNGELILSNYIKILNHIK